MALSTQTAGEHHKHCTPSGVDHARSPPSLAALASDRRHSIEIDLKTGRLFLHDHVDLGQLRTLIEVIRSC
jgi:hypothetical protein